MTKTRALAALLPLALSISCGGAPPGPVENAVILLIDTCRYDDVGRVGGTGPVTPNLDAFAGGASRFTSCTAAAPWTLPSVGTVLTGVYPTVHGALGRYPDFSRLRDEVPTGAEILAEAGFHTAAFVNVAFLDPVLGLNRGFDLYDYVGGANRKIRRAGPTVDAAIRYLETRPEGRFFLFVHFFDPHMDFDPIEPYRSRFLEGYEGDLEPPFSDVTRWKESQEITPEIRDFARALYRAEIADVDAEIGRFLAYLDGAGLAEKTAVLVTADHGEEFWDHGHFEHGHSLYEELIHVPLFLRAPGRAAAPVVSRRVGLVDVMPTLFDLLGVPSPAGFEGESLVPLMEGDDPPGPRFRYAEALLYGQEWKAVVGERYKFSWNEEARKGALFDLVLDAWERQNLAGERPEVMGEMAQRLLDWFQGVLARTGGTLQSEDVVNMEDEVIEQLRSLGYVD